MPRSVDPWPGTVPSLVVPSLVVLAEAGLAEVVLASEGVPSGVGLAPAVVLAEGVVLASEGNPWMLGPAEVVF